MKHAANKNGFSTSRAGFRCPQNGFIEYYIFKFYILNYKIMGTSERCEVSRRNYFIFFGKPILSAYNGHDWFQ